ncbi:hypothetical protein MPDQ_004264 [Monascus purpureus]|uniref:NADP-dependent oxidoreductase domain-containing protein n=1 Tax=Monascus purpureus TaxID=5098 RepID=A0A507R2W0_MONPU|nr:hypothetical protein MPDQ_004264 [Monascus purpureus]
MAIAQPTKSRMAHVNMMTDTIIANLSPDALRSIMRSLLALYPSLTATFEGVTRDYLQSNALRSDALLDDNGTLNETSSLLQARIRCMLGCNLCYQSLPLLGSIVDQTKDINDEEIWGLLAPVDADIVQAATAVQKTLAVPTGSRVLSIDEHNLLGCPVPPSGGTVVPDCKSLDGGVVCAPPTATETFWLGDRELPRIFSGLWQLSGPAWGSAPASKIVSQFARHVGSGFTAFDMADHYGDAEIIFGRFRSSYPHPDAIFAATKYCVFHPMTVSREAVRANVTERCQRLQTDRIDLLQFHWQFYDDPQYIDATRFLQEDERVSKLGLCNFDTEHLQRILDSGVKVYSNQVQFSLMDSRPTVKMGEVCGKHNVKLFTYGTLCGGFLAERWLGKPEPALYDSTVTPSQRKYYAMIQSWGGWELFQELLRVLKSIAIKRNVSISNVATRWVLDFPYVGAVIVGARMGISEHLDENQASFGWSLDNSDQDAIEDILKRSKRLEMFESMGDCGGEYR